jgi:hypothetical protein
MMKYQEKQRNKKYKRNFSLFCQLIGTTCVFLFIYSTNGEILHNAMKKTDIHENLIELKNKFL